jgi:hypothetical protein
MLMLIMSKILNDFDLQFDNHKKEQLPLWRTMDKEMNFKDN